MSGPSPRPAAAKGHTKTELRRGHLTPSSSPPPATGAVPSGQPAKTPLPAPAPTSENEQMFLFGEEK